MASTNQPSKTPPTTTPKSPYKTKIKTKIFAPKANNLWEWNHNNFLPAASKETY